MLAPGASFTLTTITPPGRDPENQVPVLRGRFRGPAQEVPYPNREVDQEARRLFKELGRQLQKVKFPTP